MKQTELTRLLDAWQDGSATQEEDRRLARALRDGGADGRWLRDEIALAGKIAQALDAPTPEQVLDGFHERRRAERDGSRVIQVAMARRRRQTTHRRRRIAVLTLVAAVLVGAIGVLLLRGEGAGPSALTVAAGAGHSAGATLAVGDRVPENALLTVTDAMVLRSPQGDRLALAPHSALSLRRSGDGWQAMLPRGDLTCTIAHRDAPLVSVRTPHTTVHVRGTTFAVTTDASATWVRVQAGRVVCTTDAGETALAPDQQAVFGPGHDGRARPTPVTAGRVAHYIFAATDGPVHDRSGHGRDLRLVPPQAARRTPGRLHATAALEAVSAPKDDVLADAVNRRRLSFAAWLIPGEDSQVIHEPLRLRATDAHGRELRVLRIRMPVHVQHTGRLVHFAACFDDDSFRLYLDGVRLGTAPVRHIGTAGDPASRVAAILSNAASASASANQDMEDHRPLTFVQATIYDRRLSDDEVARNHAAGPEPAQRWDAAGDE